MSCHDVMSVAFLYWVKYVLDRSTNKNAQNFRVQTLKFQEPNANRQTYIANGPSAANRLRPATSRQTARHHLCVRALDLTENFVEQYIMAEIAFGSTLELLSRH
ncbi:hypothetical protein Plhal304r1_c003g0012441 [Plasmopara halstedii]